MKKKNKEFITELEARVKKLENTDWEYNQVVTYEKYIERIDIDMHRSFIEVRFLPNCTKHWYNLWGAFHSAQRRMKCFYSKEEFVSYMDGFTNN